MTAPITPVEITPGAVAYVRERGGALTLRQTPRHGCCGGTVALPVAERSAPRDAAGYVRRDLETPCGPVALFVERGLDAASDDDASGDTDRSGGLRVGLDRLFGLRSLYVEGGQAQIDGAQPSPSPYSTPT